MIEFSIGGGGTDKSDAVKALVSMLRDAFGRSVRGPGDTPEHEACTCPECQIARFEVPIHPTGEAAIQGLKEVALESLSMVTKSTQGGQHTTIELVRQPQMPEVEVALMLARVERYNANVKLAHRLFDLLPEQYKEPEDADALPKPMTLDEALKILNDSREATAKKLAELKIRHEARQVVIDAVTAAAAPPAAE